MRVIISSLLAIALFAAGCSSIGGSRSEEVSGSASGEWISDNIFRIKVMATPDPGAETGELKRQSARERALNTAKQKTVRFFRIAARGTSPLRVTSYAEGSIQRLQEMAEIIRNGQIIKEKYDSNQNCTILFQVMHWGLKHKVNTIFRGGRY